MLLAASNDIVNIVISSLNKVSLNKQNLSYEKARYHRNVSNNYFEKYISLALSFSKS